MKALEKAAKDRDEARADPAGDAPPTEPAWVTASQSPPEPAEPAAPETIPPGAQSEFSTAGAPGARSQFSTAAPGARSELSLEPIATPTEPSITPPPPRPEARPAPTPRARAAATAREEQQARAATVMQAARPGRGAGAVAYLMARPVWMVGFLAILIGIGYAVYLYLQLFHPALFLPKPPLAPRTPAPSASPIAQVQDPAPAPIPGTGTIAGAPAGTAPAAPPSLQGAAPTLPPVLQAAAPEAAPPPPPPAPKSAAARTAEKPAAETTASPPPAPAPRETIVVTRSNVAPTVSPALRDAYTALRADRRDDAQRAYEQLLRTEPRNIDALLGLAAIATTEGRSEDATRRYMQILELDPRNTLAQAGMIGLVGRADPLAAESRLKQLIAREPSAYLHFTLGNLYADQTQWAAAQQAYFQAHHLEPNNPDYAFNLAVGLDHVSQSKLALTYYRRAVELAGATGTARFDVAQAQQRISRLASLAE